MRLEPWMSIWGRNHPTRALGVDMGEDRQGLYVGVESVDFDAVERFLARTEAMSPGLGLRLPTEAEWEYACRAGTDTATYVGPIEILGENNAPVLDTIAWYGGNSGVEYDLDQDASTQGWPNKQYPYSRAGTRRVKTRRRNPWGLYDMLGNVWEWCSDGAESWDALRRYSAISERDPHQPGARRLSRVVRGGSCSDSARRVRAAYRGAFARVDRSAFLGFRVARGRGPEGQGPGGAGL